MVECSWSRVSSILKVLTVCLGGVASIMLMTGVLSMTGWKEDCVDRNGSHCPSKWPTTTSLVISILAVLTTLTSLTVSKFQKEPNGLVVSMLYIWGGIGALLTSGFALAFGFLVIGFPCEFDKLTLGFKGYKYGSSDFVTCDKQLMFRHEFFLAAGVIEAVNGVLHFVVVYALAKPGLKLF